MAAACSNLSAKAARKRAVAGILALAVGVGAACWMIVAVIPRPARLALLPVLFFAALCLLQAWRGV